MFFASDLTIKEPSLLDFIVGCVTPTKSMEGHSDPAAL